jgi:hypothetical protein
VPTFASIRRVSDNYRMSSTSCMLDLHPCMSEDPIVLVIAALSYGVEPSRSA